MPICGRGGDQLADQDVLHLGARVDGEPLPAAHGLGHLVGVGAGAQAHQHGVDGVAAGLRGVDRIQQPGHTGPVEGRVGRGARAVLYDGVVVLEELRLLRVLERDEHHRVAAGGHHAPRQPDHGVLVAADAHAVAQAKPVAMSATAS
jgi:hypothetical protein